MIASNVYISDSDWHDPYNRILTPGASKEVYISKNAWIGEGSKIAKGVRIGRNSIIGLGSIVVSNVPTINFWRQSCKKNRRYLINKYKKRNLFLNKDYLS